MNASATKPNVLFVVLDQLRADVLNGELAKTVDLPNLQALMDDAVTFTNHVTVTCPCGPARASLLTGQYAMNHRAVRNGTPLPLDKPNLATELRRGGIQPLLYGYTDTSADPRHHAADDPILTSYEQVMNGFLEALEMRFDDGRSWRGYLNGLGYDVPNCDVPERDVIYIPAGDTPSAPALYSAKHSDTAFLTDRFLADLPTRGEGWLAHVTYIRPHPPFVAPAPYNSMYDPAAMTPAVVAGDAESCRTAHPFNGPSMDFKLISHMVEGFPELAPTPENTAMMRALYLALTTEVDHHFGRIIAHLKATGQYENTVIIVTADHGEMLGDHHSWGKMHYFDAAFRIPLIIRVPGRGTAGTHLSAPTESIDITPTILELIGLSIPDSMDGRSLMPLVDGQLPDDWRRFTISELDFGDPVTPTPWQTALGLTSDQCNLSVLRDARHTLVQFGGGLPPILFDHHGDGEKRNIADDPSALPTRLTLTEAMLSHRMTHADGQFGQTMVTTAGAVRGSY